MTKIKKLNLDDMTKVTISLAAVFAPLLLNSNTASASISSRLGGSIIRTAHSNLGRSYSNFFKRYAGVSMSSINNTDNFKPRLSKAASDLKNSFMNFVNSRIVTQKPSTSRGPLLDFLNRKIIIIPPTRGGQTTSGQSSTSSTPTPSIHSKHSSGDGGGGNVTVLSKLFQKLKRNKKSDFDSTTTSARKSEINTSSTQTQTDDE